MSNWKLKFKKKILFIVRLKRMRYLDINLTEYVQNIYAKNCKTDETKKIK